jgi:hypothetical protein
MLSTTRMLRPVAAVVQSRGMATEKQLKMRMNGTKNIAKITKSMKMVHFLGLTDDQPLINLKIFM